MNIKTQEKNQFDLFEQGQSVDKKIRKKTRFLLPDVKNSVTVSYETMIFIMIGFLMVCIAVFALGVEKGRYDEKKRREVVLLQQHVMRDEQPQPKPELKKGVSNVATSKPKNIKSR